jgi:transcriptional regulator with XRE-family HTH domain
MLIATRITSDVNMPASRWTLFGPWLQGQREQADVSQSEIGRRAGIHKIQLSRIENGHSGVKRETLERIVDAINDLSSTGYKIDKNVALKKAGWAPNEDDQDGLYSGLDLLSPDDRKRAIRQIKGIIESYLPEEDPLDEELIDAEHT